MALPTVEDCTGLSGAKRDLLHEFDHLLRDALVATQHKARKLDLEEAALDESSSKSPTHAALW